MNKKYITLIVLILIFSTGIRLAKINREFLGNFGQRQVYNAWVVRNFVKEGINICNSKMDALDFEGKKTPSFRDFPLVLPFVAFVCRTVGGSIEFWGRFTSVMFYSATYLILFFWLRLYFKPLALLSILFVYAFLPMSIVYSQSFILEVSALFFFCFGVLILEKYFESERVRSLVIGSLLTGVSFATRTHYGILILPIIYLFYSKWNMHMIKQRRFYLAMIIMLLIPLLWQAIAWRLAIISNSKSSLGVTLQTYILSGNVTSDSIYSNSYLYRKLFNDFTGIIFNPIGFAMVILGLITWKWERRNLFFVIYLFAILLIVVLVPEKFYKHDYYYFPIIIPGSVFAGYYVERLSETISKKYLILFLFAIFCFASLRYSLHPSFKTPDHEKAYISQSEVVKGIVPEGEKIVVFGAGVPFLYYCDRTGWIHDFKSSSSIKNTEYVLSDGKMPTDPIERLKHSESHGAKFIVIYGSSRIKENKILQLHIRQNYKLIKSTEHISVFQTYK